MSGKPSTGNPKDREEARQAMLRGDEGARHVWGHSGDPNRPGGTGQLPANSQGPRFPGFDVMAQRSHWDDATRAVVTNRLHDLPPIRFFTTAEEAAATCLLNQLMDQHVRGGEDQIELVRMVDGRLAEDQTDGWHYDDMPTDADAWRQTLAALDEDAVAVHGHPFADLDWDDQHSLLSSIENDKDKHWHGLPRARVWSLWTRYAATAFYAHPWAWNEIGFSGPAYPRGYKNPGVNKLETFEVRDAQPADDPLHRQGPNGAPVLDNDEHGSEAPRAGRGSDGRHG